MAASTLVRSEIDAGLNLIEALDKSQFGVAAALWLYASDSDKWRMVIAYSGRRQDLEKKYRDAATISASWRSKHPEKPILELSRVRITSVDDPLIKGLTPVIRMDGLGEIRFSNNVVNGIYVEDAIIHRLAA